ncbi:MAG TPA: hypothetical protein VHE59_03225 [Mucilaginibacter sp.]|nr:hypothetical protein [Mucilaginibacter sp.]
MSEQHLSDEELQKYALGQTDPIHLDNCPLCREKAAQYRQIINGLQELPKISFDFNVSELVLTELFPVKKKKTVNWPVIIVPIIAGMTILITILWLLRFLFADIGSLLAFSAAMLLLIGLKEQYGRYQKINATFFNPQAPISN